MMSFKITKRFFSILFLGTFIWIAYQTHQDYKYLRFITCAYDTTTETTFGLFKHEYFFSRGTRYYVIKYKNTSLEVIKNDKIEPYPDSIQKFSEFMDRVLIETFERRSDLIDDPQIIICSNFLLLKRNSYNMLLFNLKRNNTVLPKFPHFHEWANQRHGRKYSSKEKSTELDYVQWVELNVHRPILEHINKHECCN